MVKWTSRILIGASLTLALWVGLRIHDKNVAERARQQYQVDSLNRELGALQERQALFEEHDRAARDSISRLNSKIARLQQGGALAAHRADSLGNVLLSQLPDSLKPLFVTMDSTYKVSIVQKDSTIQAQAAIIDVQQIQLNERDSLLILYRRNLAGVIQQRDAFFKDAHPNLLKRAWQAVPFVAAALIADRFLPK